MASRIMQEKARIELKSIQEQISVNSKLLQTSRGEGDLRENADYQLAMDNVVPLANRQKILEDIILEPVIENTGSTITYGRLINVECLGICDAVGNICENSFQVEPLLLLFERTGDALIMGVLSGNSPLGLLINGAEAGDYVVQCQDAFRKYRVTLCDNRLDEYLQEFPADQSKRIEMLLSSLNKN